MTMSQLAPCHLLPQCNKKHIPKDDNEPSNFLSFYTRTKLTTNSILIHPNLSKTLFSKINYFDFFLNLILSEI
jgi:hypothetical protein